MSQPQLVLKKEQKFTGALQPAKSRLPTSQVWSRAERPGPERYTMPSSLGVQAVSTKSSFQGQRWSKETRDGAILLPNVKCGRGVLYDTVPSCGKQVTSQRLTSARTHFGTSTRDNWGAMYTAFSYKPH